MANTTARRLRRNATGAERVLWQQLRILKERGFHFRRQVPIDDYIVDFADYGSRLIIEVDGGHHNDEANLVNDDKRTEYLMAQGFRVIRFWNADVFTNLEGVVDTIHHELGLMTAEPYVPPVHNQKGK